MPTPEGKTLTRRGREARSAETRVRLLDATIDCLLERGYAGTSTPEVCERTGLSRGALLHHFPTRQDLVIEAVGRLVSRMGVESLAHAARAAREGKTGDSLDRMFEVVWQDFRQPLFHAALELWVAARTDADLHRSLYASERVRGRGIIKFYEVIAGAVSEVPGFAEMLELTLHLMRGMALQRLIRPDDQRRSELYAIWQAVARRELQSRAPVRKPGASPTSS